MLSVMEVDELGEQDTEGAMDFESVGQDPRVDLETTNPSGCHAVSVTENVTDSVARGRFSPEGKVEVSHQVTYLHDTQNEVAGVTPSVYGIQRGDNYPSEKHYPHQYRNCMWNTVGL